MREPTIARNYAETLLELASRAKDLRGWGDLIDQIATAIESDRRLRIFLESPRVSAQQKNLVIQKAFEGQLPRNFVRFLQALVTHRRQMMEKLQMYSLAELTKYAIREGIISVEN